MGKVLDFARTDARKITTEGGFETDVNLESLPPSVLLTVQGIAVRHSIGFDTDGQLVQSSNVSLTIAEGVLKDADYPYRNTQGEVDMLKHKVNYIDSSGELKYYKVIENFPDEHLGLITMILGRAANNG